MRKVLLLCEGRDCNNGMDAKEREQKYRVHFSRIASGDVASLVGTHTANSLRYREHEVLDDKHAQCTICGNVRTWG
jgi:hypothetical protein